MRKSLKICVLSTLENRWAKALIGTIQHFESAEWYSWMPIALLCSRAFQTLFLGFLELGLALKCVFNPYSKIFNAFMDNSGLFGNNYLVDKYFKINLDKV